MFSSGAFLSIVGAGVGAVGAGGEVCGVAAAEGADAGGAVCGACPLPVWEAV